MRIRRLPVRHNSSAFLVAEVDRGFRWGVICALIIHQHAATSPGPRLCHRFSAELIGKHPVCLDIPDDFQCGQPELVEVLTQRLALHLGPPAGGAAPDSVED